MPAAINELVIENGEDYAPIFTVKDFSQNPPAIVNISGWTIQLTLRVHADDTGTPLAQVSASLIGGGTGGQRQPTLSSATVLGVGPGNYAYDLVRIDSGSRRCLSKGPCTIRQDVKH